MSHLSSVTHIHQTAPVVCIQLDTDLNLAYAKMEEFDLRSIAVVNAQGELQGVLTHTDLMRVGHRQAGTSRAAAVLTLPHKSVSSVMTTPAITAGPTDSVRSIAALMVKNHVHRVFLVDDHKHPVGVVSTRDLILTVRDQRVKQPVEEFMSSPVHTIRADEPVSEAVQRLDRAHVSGLLVMDGDWPVGIFTQRDALLFQSVERHTAVEEVMNPAVLMVPLRCPIHRAAAQASVMKVRRVIVMEESLPVGILTGLDFAKAAMV